MTDRQPSANSASPTPIRSIRAPDDLWGALQAEAARRQITANALACQFIAAGLSGPTAGATPSPWPAPLSPGRAQTVRVSAKRGQGMTIRTAPGVTVRAYETQLGPTHPKPGARLKR